MDFDEEEEIIKKAKQNPEFFGQIFDIYYGKLYGYILKRVAKVEVAEDIVSEVFYKAVKAFPRFKWQNCSISSWLYKIAVNEIRLWFRSKYRAHWSIEVLQQEFGFDIESTVDLKAEIIELQDNLEMEKDFKKVQEILKKLPFKYQEILSLRFFEEKTTPEIAQILNKRQGTVRSLLSRGIKKLQFLVEESVLQQTTPSRIIESENVT